MSNRDLILDKFVCKRQQKWMRRGRAREPSSVFLLSKRLSHKVTQYVNLSKLKNLKGDMSTLLQEPKVGVLLEV